MEEKGTPVHELTSDPPIAAAWAECRARRERRTTAGRIGIFMVSTRFALRRGCPTCPYIPREVVENRNGVPTPLTHPRSCRPPLGLWAEEVWTVPHLPWISQPTFCPEHSQGKTSSRCPGNPEAGRTCPPEHGRWPSLCSLGFVSSLYLYYLL